MARKAARIGSSTGGMLKPTVTTSYRKQAAPPCFGERHERMSLFVDQGMY